MTSRETSTDLVSQLFNSNTFSDITFICSDKKELPAHRCIITTRSPVFLAMLTTEMREAMSKKIVIDDIDGETMLELLRFIYTNKVENLTKLAQNLIYAAEKYDIPELKLICAQKLIDQITNDNVFENLVLADRLGEEGLLQKCMVFIKT
jgi:speckle-type POZ protein